MWGAARRLSLTQRVMAIVAVAIVPASAALPFFIVSIHQEREREMSDLALRTSQIAALEMERIVTGAEGVLQTLALAPPIRAFEAPACSAYLAEVVNRLPQLSGLAVADPEGRVRCAAGLSFGAGGGRLRRLVRRGDDEGRLRGRPLRRLAAGRAGLSAGGASGGRARRDRRGGGRRHRCRLARRPAA